MKLILKTLFTFSLVIVLMTYSSCKKHKDAVVPITDTQIDLLSKTWKPGPGSSVTLTNNPVSTYGSFTITFTGTHGASTINYICTGRPANSPWPASGTFTFSSTNPQTQLTRDDNVAFTYSVTSAQLQLSFAYSGNGFSRTEGVSGTWSFTMVPN